MRGLDKKHFRWAAIASHLQGRTDNEIKNFWNTRLKKRVPSMDQNQLTHQSPSLEPDSVVDVQAKANGTSTSIDTAPEQDDSCKPKVDMMAVSDSFGSNEYTASSDTALKMLLEFLGDNGIDFLHEQMTNDDFFLRFCSSGVGKSFRETTGKAGGLCETKLELDSIVEVQAKVIGTSTSTDTAPEQDDSCKPKVDMLASSNSIAFNEFTCSSDTAFKELLESPGDNGMDFLH